MIFILLSSIRYRLASLRECECGTLRRLVFFFLILNYFYFNYIIVIWLLNVFKRFFFFNFHLFFSQNCLRKMFLPAVPPLELLQTHVDVAQPTLWLSAAWCIFNPLFWNIAGKASSGEKWIGKKEWFSMEHGRKARGKKLKKEKVFFIDRFFYECKARAEYRTK